MCFDASIYIYVELVLCEASTGVVSWSAVGCTSDCGYLFVCLGIYFDYAIIYIIYDSVCVDFAKSFE